MMKFEIPRTIALQRFYEFWNAGDHIQNCASLVFSGCKVVADISQSVFMSALAEAVSTDNNSVSYTIFGHTARFDQVGLVWGYGVSYLASYAFQYLSEVSITGVTEKTARQIGRKLMTKVNELKGEDLNLAVQEGHDVTRYGYEFYEPIASVHACVIQRLLPDAMASLGVLFAMGTRVSWPTFSYYGLGGGSYVLVSVVINDVIVRKKALEIQNEYNDVTSFFSGFINRKSMVENFRGETTEAQKWNTDLSNLMKKVKWQTFLHNDTSKWLRSWIPSAVVLLYLKINLDQAQKAGDEVKPAAIDDFIFFSQILPMALRSLENLITAIGSLREKSKKLRDVFAFFETSYDRYPMTNPVALPDITNLPDRGEIYVLNSVSFAYLEKRSDRDIGRANAYQIFQRKRNAVLHNITMTIRKGQRVAIVGESGCGKSTLLKLLCRDHELRRPGSKFRDTPSVLPPEIQFCGNSLYAYNISDLKSQISMESQGPHIQQGVTLKKNITYGLQLAPAQPPVPAAGTYTETTYNELVEAFNLARLNRQVQDGNGAPQDQLLMNPSGGERQRIGLARAIIRRAPIIFLDEPTSALDSNLEAKVMNEFFTRLQPNQTVVIVAHRLSTITTCSNIYVMEKGQIVESAETITGELTAHAQLLRRGYRYNRTTRSITDELPQAFLDLVWNPPTATEGAHAAVAVEETIIVPSLYTIYRDLQSGELQGNRELYDLVVGIKEALAKRAGATAGELQEQEEELDYTNSSESSSSYYSIHP